MKMKILNALIFQLGWLVCALGGSLMAVTYCLLALLIHQRYLVNDKFEWQLIGWIALVGVTWDSLLVFFGLIVYPDAVWISLPVWRRSGARILPARIARSIRRRAGSFLRRTSRPLV